MTGLDPHTLRAWERRYGAVQPGRSVGGTRRYGDPEVARLQLLKALTDCGEPIGEVARLATPELRERLERLADLAAPRPEPARGARSVAALVPGLETQLAADPGALGRLHLSVSAPDAGSLQEALAKAAADMAVVALRALGPEPLRTLERLRAAAPACLVLVLYEFATAAELARLGRSGAHLVRGPLRVAQLRRAIEDLFAIEAVSARAPLPPPPPPRDADGEAARDFDDEQLARLLETPGEIGCECPGHLASLVSSMLAFERYSRECESRTDEDAALHRRLAEGSGRIRAQLESLLRHLCRHEGIRL